MLHAHRWAKTHWNQLETKQRESPVFVLPALLLSSPKLAWTAFGESPCTHTPVSHLLCPHLNWGKGTREVSSDLLNRSRVGARWQPMGRRVVWGCAVEGEEWVTAPPLPDGCPPAAHLRQGLSILIHKRDSTTLTV